MHIPFPFFFGAKRAALRYYLQRLFDEGEIRAIVHDIGGHYVPFPVQNITKRQHDKKARAEGFTPALAQADHLVRVGCTCSS